MTPESITLLIGAIGGFFVVLGGGAILKTALGARKIFACE
jgi:hypothetical protein